MPSFAKFPLGRTFVTANAAELLEEEKIGAMLTRHVSGDWGDLDDADKLLNEHALQNGARLLSRYDVGGSVFYVITEHDRSVTTVLLPEDY